MSSAASKATTFAELWDQTKTAALNVVQNLMGKLKTFEAKAVPVIESDLVAILAQLNGVATATAATLATQEFSNLTGGQKQAITVNSIMATAVALGKPVIEQDAQMLAQQAYHGTMDAIATLAPTAGK